MSATKGSRLKEGAELRTAGFAVGMYGPANTVFAHPRLDGYWVADYTGSRSCIRGRGSMRRW